MAAFRKAPPPPAKRRPVVASAMQYSFGGAQTWKILPEGDRRWQQEAWYQYDICGELRYATGWKGNACAQATLYAADVDPMTGRPIGATENTTVQQITDSILGGPVRRPQHIRTMAVNLEMVGEVYVVVAAGIGGAADEWLVISSTEMKLQGKNVEYVHPRTGMPQMLKDTDLLIRIWSPHPRLQLNADSAVRALLPTLREIERTSQNIAARLDSRLVGSGLLLISDEIDFPEGDDDPAKPGGLMGLMVDAAQASLNNPGSASSQVPIVIEVPPDHVDAIKHITFETPLSKEIIDLRTAAIERLAAGLDLPREVIEGMGQSNHWSAWQVAEDTYKTHLLPLLDLMSDALTVAFLTPTLEAKHVPNPGSYLLAFDGTSLIGEPDPLAESITLYEHGLISGEAVRSMTSTPEDFAPTEDERLRAIAEKLVTSAPTLFAEPELRRRLGFLEEAIAVPKTTAGIVPVAAAEPLVAPGTAAPADGTGVVPAANQPPQLAASGAFRAASLAVTYALERAGNKLLNTQADKRRYAAVPRCELHIALRPDPDRHGDLIADAWRHAPVLAVQYDLDGYTRALLAAGAPHTDDNLVEWLARRG